MTTQPPIPSDPRDQRNLFIAVVATMLVIMAWKIFYADPLAQQQAVQQSINTQKEQLAAHQSQPATAPTVEQLPVDRASAITGVSRVQIHTKRLHGSIALKGVRFDDVTLADYRETTDKDSPEVVLLTPRTAKAGYFMESGWASTAVRVPDAQTEWAASHDTLTPTQPVVFSWDNGAGVRFEQEVAVDEGAMFTLTQRVINSTAEPISLAPYSLINRTVNTSPDAMMISHEGMMGVHEDRLEEYSYEDIEGQSVHIAAQTTGWAGITDKYWLTALIPDSAQHVPYTTTYQHYVGQGDHRYQVDMLGEVITVPASGTHTQLVRMFSGAKEVDLLTSYEQRYKIPLFERAIDFGVLYFLTRPIFSALQFLNSMIGNVGIAILVLTVLIKALMFPLANKSYASMSQMKLLMPKMKELQERYADDRLKMNQEIMGMYKEEGVNPASGCLPLLLQIPVFFALYKVLYVTIEMRHAPFYGWIHDLSAADPTNVFTLFGLIPWDPPFQLMHIGIWPLIMVVTMIIQQRLNPKPSDPTQAQVMMFMPYIFLFMCASFPVGLVIYWAWNNVLSITQQMMIMRRFQKLYDPITGKRLVPIKKRK
ncbi:MAG: membrane protein insertase YidC [Alphaproteobacteria bacterium]|nr:MAG: membrane protein insertase YidC [Alphaproteobacteria bacterium]